MRPPTGTIAVHLRSLSLWGTRQAVVPVPPPATPPVSTVTVIVPTRNEERNTEACIR